jgi:hypothetical protein
MLKLHIAVMSVVLAAAQSAVAQTSPPPAFIPPPPSNSIPSGTRPGYGLDEMRTRLYREEAAAAVRKQKIAEQEALKTSSPERLARAERVAALLNQSRCADAAKLALDEGDQELANRVGQICRKTAKR